MDLPNTIAELEELKKQIDKKISLLSVRKNQSYKEGIYKLLNTKNFLIPPQYIKALESFEKEENPDVIINSIMNNDKLIKFPILMVLLQVWPHSKITLREKLIQLFDSHILRRGIGYALADIINFPTDDILEACRDHNPYNAMRLIEEQLHALYKFDMTKYNLEKNNNEATMWLNLVMSSLQYIQYIIEDSQEDKTNIFALSMNFIMGRLVSYDDYSILTVLNGINPTTTTVVQGHYGIFNSLVDEVNSNGSDYMYSKSILPAFKGITI